MNHKKNLIKGLASVKFTVIIFVYIVVLCVMATLLPQNQPLLYYELNYGQALAKLFIALQLNHVFTSMWFLAGGLLLSLNLLSCTYQRWQWSKINYYKLPKPRILNAEETQCEQLPMPASKLEDAVHKRFKGYHWSPPLQHEEQTFSWAGVKGRIKYWGSPILHLGLCIVLAGSFISIVVGQQGFYQICVGEQKEITVGPQPYILRVDAFDMAYYEDGITPLQYTSTLTAIYQGAEEVFTASVNHPAQVFKTSITQSSYDRVIHLLIRDSVGNEKEISLMNGDTLQLDEDGHFTLAARLENIRTPSNQQLPDGEPVLLCMLLHQREPVSAERLYLGEAKDFIPGLNIQFHDYQYITGVQIKYDPGIMVIFTGFIAVMIGLVIRFITPSGIIYINCCPNKNGVEMRWKKTLNF